jgi:hypothetical protein
MSSTQRRLKQNAGGFFIPVGNVATGVLAYNPGSGAGGSFVAGNFVLAAWAQGGSTPVRQTSTISSAGAGGLLRDMGKTVVSSGRTFRKVQLMTSTISTGGVNGQSGTTPPNTDYLTAYIEIASGPNSLSQAGSAAPVAYFPSVL